MTIWLWIGFVLLILALLGLDLGVFHRVAHVITVQEALAWTGLWIALALIFNIAIYYMYEHHWLGVGLQIGHHLSGTQAALQFLTGYIIEKSLSLDNIFVFAVIFRFFNVPAMYQHRVLFWGVLGALVMRGLMIAGGAALIARFAWASYVFGGLLLITAVKLLIVRHDNIEPERNPLIRAARRLLPVTPRFEGSKFLTRTGGRLMMTPLFLVLLMVESSDVLFAVDSIPAIFAVTRDPFLVFTSNVFAILGLRALYFAVAGLLHRFRYVKMSLVFVLAFVGVKMILAHHHPIPTWVSLSVIVGMLTVGISASIVGSRTDTAALVSPVAEELSELAAVSWKQARRVLILFVGSTVLLIGLAMVLLPGPAIVVIPAGLAILAGEFTWARWALHKLKDKIRQAAGR